MSRLAKLLTFLVLAGCNSTQTYSANSAIMINLGRIVSPLSPTSKSNGVSLPLLWVSDGNYLSAYQLSDNGDVAPSAIIQGSNTGFQNGLTQQIASGPRGETYVVQPAYDQSTQQTVWQILRFRPHASGNVSPDLILNCGQQIIASNAIAVGSFGQIAFSNLTIAPPPPYWVSIALLPGNSTSCPSDHKQIYGSNTGLDQVQGLAIDGRGTHFVLKQTAIEIFKPGALGNVAPARTISGSHTHLSLATGIAVDSAGYIYVASDLDSNSISVFRPNANGDATPVRRIIGSNTQLYNPIGIAVSLDGRIFVLNNATMAITVYAPGATGNVAPVQVISGSATGINGAYITIAN